MNPILETLTPTERKILRVLIRHRNEPIPHDQLIREAYGCIAAGRRPGALVGTHVSNMRHKGIRIHTRRYVGYYVGSHWEPRQKVRRACHCGELYELRTGKSQDVDWTACPEHRDARYQQARAELDAWRSARAS